MPTTAWTGSDQNQDCWTSSGTSAWGPWTPLLEPPPAPTGVHVSRKLELGIELKLEPRHGDTGSSTILTTVLHGFGKSSTFNLWSSMSYCYDGDRVWLAVITQQLENKSWVRWRVLSLVSDIFHENLSIIFNTVGEILGWDSGSNCLFLWVW